MPSFQKKPKNPTPPIKKYNFSLFHDEDNRKHDLDCLFSILARKNSPISTKFFSFIAFLIGVLNFYYTKISNFAQFSGAGVI